MKHYYKLKTITWLVVIIAAISFHRSDKTDRYGTQKKTHALRHGFFRNKLTATYFHMGTPTLSLALRCFTAEFGMGSGGATLLKPSNWLSNLVKTKTSTCKIHSIDVKRINIRNHDDINNHLGLHNQASRLISTG